MKKKLIGLALSAAMLFSVLSVPAFAAAPEESADAVAQGNIGDGVGLLLFFGAAGGEETVLLLCSGLFSGQSGVCALFRGG